MRLRIITLLIFFIIVSDSFPQAIKFGEARGFFMSIGVGPRFPAGRFADRQNLGVGFEASLSYTDNRILPVFLYTRLGYQHFPGAQSLYKNSDYSSLSSNIIPLDLGVRYFFPPVFENVVILMPVIEGGLSFAIFENLHQFKIDSGRNNFVEETTKLGFHAGAGVSMFLLELMGHYTYFHNNQYLSLNVNLRIPIFMNF